MPHRERLRQEAGLGHRRPLPQEHFFRLCAEALRKLGWRAYADLDEYERKLVDQSPPTDVEDPTQAMYKVEPVLGAGFPTGWNIRVYRPEKVT